MDFILNGEAHGDVASILMKHNCDVNALRLWESACDKRTYMTVIRNGVPVAVPIQNTVASLRKDEWKLLDDEVIKAAKQRLRAVADLRGAGLEYTIPNGMGKTVLETETQSDISAAVISMDGERESQADRPVYELSNLPLPIIHKDFYYPMRQVMVSRNGNSPLDTTTAAQAATKVAEEAEKLLLGTSGSYTYGGGTIYGYTNFPSALTKTLTSPTASSWTPVTTLQEVLDMRWKSQNAYHYGPWMLYNSPSWDAYLDDDFSSSKGDNTLRDRIKKINGIQDVRTLDFLTGYKLILVQMTSDVVREVIGMDITTVQWPSNGGMRLNFKVMAIMVPQLRADQNGKTGIVYGSV